MRDEAELLSLAALIGDRLSEAHARHGGTRETVDVGATLELAFDLASALTRTHLALVERSDAERRLAR